LNEYDQNRETLTVYGGKFYNFNPANNVSEGNNTSFVAEGCEVVEANDIYTVVKNSAELIPPTVATVNGNTYINLQEAVNAASGQCIELMEDVDLGKRVTITNDVTIDLNGKTITSSECVFVVEAGTLTIEGAGTVKANVDYDNGMAIAVWARGGHAIINGGTYYFHTDEIEDAYNHQTEGIYTSGGGTLKVYGGEFHSSLGVWTLNEHDSNRGTLTVYRGTFHNFDPSNNVSEGVGTNFVAEGSEVVEVDGIYIVKEIPAVDPEPTPTPQPTPSYPSYGGGGFGGGVVVPSTPSQDDEVKESDETEKGDEIIEIEDEEVPLSEFGNAEGRTVEVIDGDEYVLDAEGEVVSKQFTVLEDAEGNEKIVFSNKKGKVTKNRFVVERPDGSYKVFKKKDLLKKNFDLKEYGIYLTAEDGTVLTNTKIKIGKYIIKIDENGLVYKIKVKNK